MNDFWLSITRSRLSSPSWSLRLAMVSYRPPHQYIRPLRLVWTVNPNELLGVHSFCLQARDEIEIC